MSDLYTSLQVSPKKKRCPPTDDIHVTTPKRLRTAPPTPPTSASYSQQLSEKKQLPPYLSRLLEIQVALQHALSHALATCAISPTPDSGHVKNVLNHLSLATYSGFSTTLEVQDIQRLCWLWEWDEQAPPTIGTHIEEEEDNPFLDDKSICNPISAPSSDWTRGSMGFVLSSATHFSRSARNRIPAYGIGIEVEMDIDKDMGGGMAAVARWTAQSDKRLRLFRLKLERWMQLHENISPPPGIPLADIPDLALPKVSALTRTLASCSPSAIPANKLPAPPSSPSRSPKKKPHEFALPFLNSSPQKSPIKKGTILFPQTPSRRDDRIPFPPITPSTRGASPSVETCSPITPTRQKDEAASPHKTPSTSRRDALYERIRQRSLSKSPTKPSNHLSGVGMTRDHLLKLGQDELRRRCLLGRLGGVAESIWMLFSNPSSSSSSSTPSGRKRRALPLADIIAAIIKSSPVPVSNAEANESVTMLLKLCPFFVKKLEISGKDWLEMPAPSNTTTTDALLSPTKTKSQPSRSLNTNGKEDSARELLTRSPKRVKKEASGLREVREIIRRELDLQDYD